MSACGESSPASSDVADVDYATDRRVNWYNNRRLHSTPGNIPVEYEQAHCAALNRETPRVGTAESLGRFGLPTMTPGMEVASGRDGLLESNPKDIEPGREIKD